MCGIVGIVGSGCAEAPLRAMLTAVRHRGPDAQMVHTDAAQRVGLGHARLRIIDLSEAADGPMTSADGRYVLVHNGEVYNHVELRAELATYPFRTQTDTEVILAAFAAWGPACLDRLIGMFAFAVWDREERRLFVARDRFGVKPLHFHHASDGTLYLASEIQALRAAGVPTTPNETLWASYLATGRSDRAGETFWAEIQSLPAGHYLTWANGTLEQTRWYDLAAAVGPELDHRDDAEVAAEYRALLEDAVRLRFRSDVEVGVNLSGGLDSSLLTGLICHVLGAERRVRAFTFTCGDADYDELPWVQSILASTSWDLVDARLAPADVPRLAASVQTHEQEPFGGLPTLAYAGLFEAAAREGVTVLLDGQGMDEQWAGYDTYARIVRGDTRPAGLVQGTTSSPVRPECLLPEFAARATPGDDPTGFPDALRSAQLRDITRTKLPRALRFNDRISMRVARELREPFLDHRLFELALRQPPERTNDGTTGKLLLRRIAADVVPAGVRNAPKRALQTPQREWLRGPLRTWTEGLVEAALDATAGTWLDRSAVDRTLRAYMETGDDNSFYVWQWLNLGLMVQDDGWSTP